MDGNVLLAIAGGIVAIAVVVYLLTRRRQPVEEAPPPPPREYEVTLYSGGEVAKTFTSSRISTGDGKGYAVELGNVEYSIFGGNYVIEPKGSAKNPLRTPGSKYVVRLYSGGKAVREWYAVRTSTGNGKVYVLPEGADEYTIIGGTYLVEPTT